MNREQLLKRAGDYSFVPGHGPNIDDMTDEKLERFVGALDHAFDAAFRNEEEGEDDL